MKLHGPLLSLAAKGTIGKAVSFITKHGTTHAQQKPDHPDANSPAQKSIRDGMTEARNSWSDILINSTERSAWQRLNTYRVKKHTSYNAWISQIVQLRQTVDIPSIATQSSTIAGRRQQWIMTNIPSGAEGDEAGSFAIWSGPSPTKLKHKEIKSISAGTITSSGMSESGDELYAALRKDGYWRSGIEELAADGEPPPTGVPVGIVEAYAGLTVPSGWLLCDGTAVSRTTYASLFTAIGTIYGIGDGATTYNLPDLVDYFIRGGIPDGVANADKTKIPDIPFAADNDNANHNHGATDNQSADHTHTGTSGCQSASHQHTTTTGIQSNDHTHTIGSNSNHYHRVHWERVSAAGDVRVAVMTAVSTDWVPTSTTGAHNHGGNTGGLSSDHTHTGTSGNQSASHTHTTTTGNQSASHAHNVANANATHGHTISGGDAETRPQNLLMKYIIKAL